MTKRGHKRGGKKNRKYGRNAVFCKFYQSQKKREKNKLTKLKKHLLKHVNDKQALKAIKRYERFILGS